jgi:DNA-binding beta-propeller fold protein YncE
VAAVNRKTKIASLTGAGVLAAALAGYFIAGQRDSALPGQAAVLLPAPVPTKASWAARVALLAGDGEEGVLDGAAAQSRFSDPFGVAVDPRGTVFVADGGDSNRIRRIERDGTVSTFAGGREGYADGAGAAAAFHTPSALALDRFGNLYVADTGNHAIRKIAPDGSVTTLAGDGQPGDADGRGAAARFRAPVGLALDQHGNVYVADTYNDRIRRITPEGVVTTLAGGVRPGNADGPAIDAAFDTPSAIAVGKDGSLFVADTGNNAIRRIGPDGVVSTLAAPLEGERQPLLRRPTGLALTHDGYLYIAGGGGRILQLAPNGELRALDDADHPPESAFGADGKVRLYAPHGIGIERDGSLVVADALALRVLRLSPPKRGEAAPVIAAPRRAPRSAPMPWPVGPQDMPHEVVGLMGEVRGSYDGESRDHFHAGLDVRADIGTRVLAIAPSKISDPFANWGFGSLSEGMAVGPLSYIHMRVGRDSRDKPLDARFGVLKDARGKPDRVRVPRGTRFAVGDALGTINSMAHVHLDYYPGGALVNPLTLPFPGVTDTIAPRIQDVSLYDSSGRRLGAKKGQPVRIDRALGEVAIVADGYDQMDGNLARRRLGLYKLGYQLLRPDGSALPGFEQPLITQVYDRLPREREAVKLLYAANSGITVYGSKATRFAYAVNNTLQGGRVAPGTWRVGALAPGDYILRIYAADYAGHVAVEGRDLAIRVE